MLYWLAIFPVDVIKSAMMADAIDPAQRRYPTMLSTAKARRFVYWGRRPRYLAVAAASC